MTSRKSEQRAKKIDEGESIKSSFTFFSRPAPVWEMCTKELKKKSFFYMWGVCAQDCKNRYSRPPNVYDYSAGSVRKSNKCTPEFLRARACDIVFLFHTQLIYLQEVIITFNLYKKKNTNVTAKTFFLFLSSFLTFVNDVCF